jgi:hypothetical protein
MYAFLRMNIISKKFSLRPVRQTHGTHNIKIALPDALVLSARLMTPTLAPRDCRRAILPELGPDALDSSPDALNSNVIPLHLINDFALPLVVPNEFVAWAGVRNPSH